MAENTKDNETKIVKASSKAGSDKDANASKVQIRAVDKAIIEAQQQKKTKAAENAAKKTEASKSSSVKSTEKSASKASAAFSGTTGRTMPVGKPMPKNAVPQNAIPKKKSEVPQNIDKPEEKQSVKEEAEAEIKAEELKTEAVAAEVHTKDAKTEEITAKTEKTEEQAYEKSSGKEEAQKAEKPEGSEKSENKTEDKEPKSEKTPTSKSEKKEKDDKSEKAESSKSEKKNETKAEKSAKADDGKKTGSEKKEHGDDKSDKAEDKKAEEKKPAAPAVDYTPGIGVKIIRRAADEPKPEPKKPVEKKPAEPRRNDRRQGANKSSGQGDKPQSDRRSGGNGQGRGDKNRSSQGGTDNRNSFRKNGQNGSSDRKPGEKVVAYTAPAGSTDSRRPARKDDKSKKSRRDYEEIPADLSRSIKKKHSKYKDRSEEPVIDEVVMEAQATGSVLINVPITLAGFCEQVERSTSEAIMALMKMGIMANINQNLDEETAVLLGMELGVSVMVNKSEAIELEEGIDAHEDRESELLPRAPIVTVMGHVDHGKTSLLDAIRNTNVTAGEAGGITQHIGASEIEINGKHVVFLDTPGHEAFTAMRARGAHITDIAVLVVAADDSVMPQTIESISHAKAAGVPIIVAMNKMDKPTANPDRVKQDLASNGVLVEDWGGDTICVPVSAKTGEGITQLLEMILLQAEMLELKANPNRLASGTVIEARLDKSKGPVATLLVMNGTLQAGAALVAGMASGRVRVMTNPKGEAIKKAGPARAAEITGLTEVPEAGDEFYMVKDEKTAREIAEKRKLKLREDVMAKNASISLEKLFSQLEEGEVKDLNLIVKADVMGSVGALESSLEKLHNENVRVRIIHSAVGAINEGDVMLAETSNAVIIGFNVRPSSAVTALADEKSVEIRTYRVIYEIIEDIEAAMKGMLDPEFKESVIGKIEVRDTFKVSSVGTIAGGYVLEGKVQRGAKLRLVRDGIVIHEGEIASLRRFKDDVREVNTGYECGISIDKFNDIKIGDIIEAFVMEEVKRD